MSVEFVDDGRISGAKAADSDVDASAGINPLKVEKHSLFLNWSPSTVQIVSGSPVANIVSVFSGWKLPDAAASSIAFNLISPRTEISPGDRATLWIWMYQTAASGMVRLVVDIRPVIEGSLSVTSALQRAVAFSPNQSTLSLGKIDFPPAIFSNGQIIGIKISRDPANALDTIAADLTIFNCSLEVQGRC